MFGMSMTEIVIILVVALLVIGPKELPKVAKTLGKAMRDVRRAGDDLRETFDREVMDEPRPRPRPVAEAVAAPHPNLLPPQPVAADAPVSETEAAEPLQTATETDSTKGAA